MDLELLILAAFLAVVVDLALKRGVAAVAVSGLFALAIYLDLAKPATNLLKLGSLEWGLLFFISVVYFTISIYSFYYIKEVERKRWFWAWMNLFYASMVLFVAADHWALLLVGWGGLDIASWGLILTYRDEEDQGRVGLGGRSWGIEWLWTPSASALRAILTVEVGTAAILAGIGIATRETPYISQWGVLPDVAAVMFLIGAFAKAAQLPFTDWLMTAMSAPTPVSALLHSSTMVKAGPILLLKLGHAMPTWAIDVAFVVGIATALYGGLVALAQREPKVLLASSTASYLGLITAFVLKHPAEALWLIYSHGVAKATLFMAVGHAIHTNHSRVPEQYPAVAKISIFIALLTLVGLTPLGAAAKAEAEWWLLIFSLLTAGYIGKLILRTQTVWDWGAMAWPYTALVIVGSFSVLNSAINPVWGVALAGLALSYLPTPELLYKRLGLPLLSDLVIPTVFKTLAKFVTTFDRYIDRVLMSATSLWMAIYGTVAALEKAIDLWLHDWVPEMFRATSRALSRLSFEYYLYLLGVALGVVFILAVWLWI